MRAGFFALAAATASRAAKAARSSSSPAGKKPSPSSSSSSSSKSSSASSSKITASPSPKPSPTPPRAKPTPPPNRICSLSPALAKLLDIHETTRPDALKRVWVYIKAQNLQNQLDKKEILCDEKLKALFGRDKVTISELLKVLSPHISKKE